TLGANTFFTKRSHNSICGIGQVNYWLQEEKDTLLSASIHLGEDAIFAAPGLGGDFDTIVELPIHHKFTRYLQLILQPAIGWDPDTPVGTGQWYSFMGIFIYHATCSLDANFRGEWFDDVHGTRTGFSTAYTEFTFGLDYHPYKWISLRPEARIDSSDDARAF